MTAFGAPAVGEPAPSRLLVLALDAADRGLICRWAADGHLPTFARLLREGATLPIATPDGVLEGAVWPTLISGASPARHGMLSYLQLKPGTYDLTWGIRADRLTQPTFFEHLSRAGKRVVAVDVPFDRPKPGLHGLQVVNWGAHDGLWSWPRSSWPPALIEEVASRFGNHPVPTCDRGERTLAEYVELRDGLLRGVARKTELMADLMSRGAWDFFFGVFSESHCVGHQCWHFHDPSHPRHDPAAPPELFTALRDVYAATDAGVGRLLDVAPAGTHTLVILSHGMGPYYAGSHLLEDILERLGIDEAPGRAAPLPTRDEAVAGIARGAWGLRRVVPARLRRRLKTGVAGGVAQTLWSWTHPEVNRWHRMRAFPVPTNSMTGAIRINLAGREPAGIVNPGPEYEALCTELTEAFLELENADTGQPAVQWVRRAAELYEGPKLGALPDLFIEWCHDQPISALRSPRIGTIRRAHRGNRTGHHFPGGLAMAGGPRFAALADGPGLRTLDIAPTVLDFFGVPRPDDFDGASVLSG